MPVGDRFGKLVVTSEPYLKLMRDGRRRRWVALQCDCGTSTEALLYDLTGGKRRSCGCRRGNPGPRTAVQVGDRFGRLVIISEPYFKPRGDGRNRGWARVRCDCGTDTEAMLSNVLQGRTRSCGCVQREATIMRSTTHGAAGTRLYDIWRGMHRRCTNPNADNYKWYGAKGIRVCPEWVTFEAFQQWAVANGYAKGLELDRENSDKDYCPGNCRWITKKANIRRVGLFWSNELDARLVAYASERDQNPYEVIRLAVEAFLQP
jgi:hypothetical protein